MRSCFLDGAKWGRAGSRRRPESPHLASERRRGLITQAAVRPLLVVLGAPRGDLAPRVEQVLKPTGVQALLPQPSMKTLDVRVLHRLAGLDVDHLDAPLDAPRQKLPAGKLRPVVAAQRGWFPSFLDQVVEHPRHPPAAQTRIHFQRQALPRVRIPRRPQRGASSTPGAPVDASPKLWAFSTVRQPSDSAPLSLRLEI